MNIFSRIWTRLTGKTHQRRFTAADFSRLTDWVLAFSKINADLKRDYQTLTLRARDLAKNNEFVAAWLSSLRRNVIGPKGFTLQSRAKSAAVRKEIEELWREYMSRCGGYVTLDEMQSGRDFDDLVLRTLMIDGEVFIHRIFDPASKFGWRYEIIDSLEIDPYYSVETDPATGDKIVMGIRFDRRGRELAFYHRASIEDRYLTGAREEIPAKDVIHIFRKNFPDQSRGYSPLAPVILNLNQLDGYKEAEVVHARIAACSLGVWEQTGNNGDDFLDEQDEKGELTREIKPGIWAVAPRGYTAKFLQNAGPNSQFAAFWKSLIRSAASALGVSYNKAAGDYESTSYSSLREATLEDRATYEDLQNFIVESWKDVQFRAFISDAIETGKLALADHHDMAHRFFGRQQSWVDPKAEIEAKGREYQLLLTDPVTELESRGIDPEETLDRWQEFRAMCLARGLDPDTMLGVVIQKNNDNNEGEDNGQS